MSKTPLMKPTKTVLASLCFLLSLALCTTPALADDISETQKLAAQGNADAQYKLGKMYEEGKIAQPDAKNAVEWYKKILEWYQKPRRRGMLTHSTNSAKSIMKA